MHLNGYHQVTMKHYITNYVLQNGDRVFPTYYEYQKNNYVFKITEPISMKETVQEDKGLIEPSMLSSESEDSDCEGK